MTRRQGDKVTGGLRYIGGGAFLPHVPARDLSVAEVELYAELLSEAEAAGTLAGLYQPLSNPTQPAPGSGTEGTVGGASGEKGEVRNA